MVTQMTPLTEDTDYLKSHGWVEGDDGNWTLTKGFSGHNHKRQLQHVPTGIVRDTAGAIELERVRVDDEKMAAGTLSSEKATAAYVEAMNKMEEKLTGKHDLKGAT